MLHLYDQVRRRRLRAAIALDTGLRSTPSWPVPSLHPCCGLGAALLAAVLLLSPAARGEERANCPALFAGGQPPALLNPKLAARTHELCFDAFAVLASGLTRGPLWSAEHPTAASLQVARGQAWVNLFHVRRDVAF